MAMTHAPARTEAADALLEGGRVMTLRITVRGVPCGQGSKTRTRHGMIDANAHRLRPWRQTVKSATEDALPDVPLPMFGRGVPLHVAIAFTFARPLSHYGTGRNADVLKPAAPRWFTGTPDIDKAIRAVLDALTEAGAWWDDRQVASVTATKNYAGDPGRLDVPGAVIDVEEIPT